jgi:hypothetical protein
VCGIGDAAHFFQPLCNNEIGMLCDIARRYFLAKNVFVCANNARVVVLDLNCERYMTLHERAAALLGRYVVDWPIPAHADSRGSGPTQEACRLLNQLASKGLLTNDPMTGRSAAQAEIAPPTETLFDSIYLLQPAIRAHHVAAFLLCAYRARIALRYAGMKKVIERVGERKLHASQVATFPDNGRTLMLAAIFNRLRPLALDGRDGCLLHSLALLEFLAHYGLFVQWVFGVRAVPFTAHCWLQQGSVLINDLPQRAGYLTPILVL